MRSRCVQDGVEGRYWFTSETSMRLRMDTCADSFVIERFHCSLAVGLCEIICIGAQHAKGWTEDSLVSRWTFMCTWFERCFGFWLFLPLRNVHLCSDMLENVTWLRRVLANLKKRSYIFRLHVQVSAVSVWYLVMSSNGHVPPPTAFFFCRGCWFSSFDGCSLAMVELEVTMLTVSHDPVLMGALTGRVYP